MIYITGCNKSGTTLLCRLFYAFQDMEVIDKEIDFETMLRMCGRYPPNTVCKRGRMTPFGWDFNDNQLATIIQVFRKAKVKIVTIIRDGRDVVTSDTKVSGTRWIASARQFIEWNEFIDCPIRYEDLVTHPDVVQKQVESILGLTSKHAWSTYPNFVPDKAFENPEYQGERYKPRPISNASIGKDLQAYKKSCRHVLHAFDDCLYALGYKKNLELYA